MFQTYVRKDKPKSNRCFLDNPVPLKSNVGSRPFRKETRKCSNGFIWWQHLPVHAVDPVEGVVVTAGSGVDVDL